MKGKHIREGKQHFAIKKRGSKSFIDFLEQFGMNPHPKVHSRKYWQNQIKKNQNKVITILINYEKILVKIIKFKMLGWGYRPPLEHSPIKLKKGEIKFKTRRKKMTLAEKNKFLARLNKGRIKAGLKPIRAKR